MVQQRYIRFKFTSLVKLHGSITVSIKRMELGLYLIPYGGDERFIQNLNVGSAAAVFEAN